MSEQEAMAAVNRSGDVGPATPGALVKTGLPGALVKVEDWRKAGIAILQVATDDATRVAVRDAALRVQQAAEVIEDRERQVAAAEVVQRCNREIGRAHGAGQARNRGGRPRKDADGDNRQPGLTVSRASARNYRADAEAMSDQGFETVAEAARDAGLPLDRRTVREAGRIEAEGGDPGDAVRQPKTKSHGQPTVHPAVLEAVGKVFTGGMVDGPIAIRGDGGEVVRLGLSSGYSQPWRSLQYSHPLSPNVWVCPPARLERVWAERLLTELDRSAEEGRVGMVVAAFGGDTTAPELQRLLGHDRLTAVTWLQREHAPARLLLGYAVPRGSTWLAWSRVGPTAMVEAGGAPWRRP